MIPRLFWLEILLRKLPHTLYHREHVLAFLLKVIRNREFVHGLRMSPNNPLTFELFESLGERNRVHISECSLQCTKTLLSRS